MAQSSITFQNEGRVLVTLPCLFDFNTVLDVFPSISLPKASRFHKFETCLATTEAADPSWTDVHAIVAPYSPTEDRKRGPELLSSYAAKTFCGQPTRRFVRGFHLDPLSGAVEFWAFDRGGSYMLESFNVLDETDRFAQALVDLLRLNRDEAGMDTVISRDQLGQYIVLDERKTAQQDRIYIERTYMITDMVAQGTVACFRGRTEGSQDSTLAIRFIWRPEEQRPEQDLLAMLEQKDVGGIVRSRGHRNIDSLSKIRTSLGHEAAGSSFENMIFSCLVVTPYGRHLWDFSTPIELLITIRDAIKAHKSLLQQGGLLHQDVSPFNIIMVPTTQSHHPYGILIDLDVAMDVAVGPKHEGEVYGSKPFMAIEVLQRKLHTYRHDLESFLYTLLWVAISEPKQMPPATSKLWEWMKGSFPEVVETKMRHLEAVRFGEILEEFSPSCQGVKVLAQELHNILFPVVEGSLFTGTDTSDEGTEKLYGSVIAAFEKAILAVESTTSSL
jgi:Fungal protein kinase